MDTGKLFLLDAIARLDTPTLCVGKPVTVFEDDFLRCRADEPLRIGSSGCPDRAANKCSQVDRPISTGELNTLLHLHFQPINLVFYQEPDGET